MFGFPINSIEKEYFRGNMKLVNVFGILHRLYFYLANTMNIEPRKYDEHIFNCRFILAHWLALNKTSWLEKNILRVFSFYCALALCPFTFRRTSEMFQI